MRSILLILAGGVLAAGCAHDTKDAPPRTDSFLNPPTAMPAKEPAFTADTHFAAAQLAEAQNNTAAAVLHYKAAIKINARHLPSLYRLGVLYAKAKQFPLALETWNAYVKASGKTDAGPSLRAEAYSNLGFCLELAGKPNDAEAAYQKGLTADPKNPACHTNLGLLLARKGRIAESLVELEAVMSKPEAHYNLASVYESQGMKEQAKLEYRKAIELNPDFADAHARLNEVSSAQ